MSLRFVNFQCLEGHSAGWFAGPLLLGFVHSFKRPKKLCQVDGKLLYLSLAITEELVLYIFLGLLNCESPGYKGKS